jgi:hypothetical protein
MTIRFQINKETILKSISTEEWEAMEMAQDGEAKIYRLRPLLARFMVDDEGKPIEHKAALKTLGKLPFEEFMSDVFQAFFKALQGTAVNPQNGNSLSLPSAANTPPSEFPAGSQS